MSYMTPLINKIKYDPEYKKYNHAINTFMYLGCLGLAQILKGSIVAAFPLFLPCFFCCQFIGSTFEGGFSDFYKRSTILNITLCVILVFVSVLAFSHGSQSVLVNSVQLICVGLIGLGGNSQVLNYV